MSVSRVGKTFGDAEYNACTTEIQFSAKVLEMRRILIVVATLLLASFLYWYPFLSAQTPVTKDGAAAVTTADLLVGLSTADGADNAGLIQRAVDGGTAQIRFPKGRYRISKTITVNLAEVGPTSFSSDGTTTLVMTGPGPAIRYIGTHGGTASPHTMKPDVWEGQRTPLVDGLEITATHPEADGIAAKGTMQLTVSRTTITHVRHAVRLQERNRNVTLSECHLYDNHGIGVFLDGVNLHQINVANCHISYNDAGGIVAKQSEIRNLQVGTCDIEGNMGGAESLPTANILLDSTDSSIGEVAIVGCTIQHSHDAPQSANIRILGRCTKRPFTEELRHGNITIANNVLSDVRVNIELQEVRGAAITGNTIWKGYDHNLRVVGCKNIVVGNNVFDRNPRYGYGDGNDAKLGILFRDTQDSLFSANHIYGCGDIPVAVQFVNCQRMNIQGCSVLDFAHSGMLLQDCVKSRVGNNLIDGEIVGDGFGLRVQGGRDNVIEQ